MKKSAFFLSLFGLLACPALATVVFSDNFNGYANGSLTNVSGGVWTTHSGTPGEVDVLNGRVNLTSTEGEDVSAALAGAPISSGSLFYSMLVNFSGYPTNTGGYFAHFRDTGTSLFRARLFATTNGVTDGFYRLGIAAGSSTMSVAFPTDLAYGVDHLAVVSYNLATTASTLWVDPTFQSDPSVTATDVPTTTTANFICLRQSRTTGTSMGTLTVDNLIVADTFLEVVPEPSVVSLVALGGLLGLVALRRRKA